MSERQRGEKEEKEEKRQEKEEKSWDEKWQRDPVNVAMWAAILIWVGLVLLVDNLDFTANLGWWEGWAVAFMGAGVIVLVQVLIRILVPAYRKPVGGDVILGFVFLGIGLGDMVGWDLIWPIIIIALGVSLFARGLLRRR